MSVEDRVRDVLREQIERTDVSLPPVDDVFARARRQTTLTGAVVLGVLVVVVVMAASAVGRLGVPGLDVVDQPGAASPSDDPATPRSQPSSMSTASLPPVAVPSNWTRSSLEAQTGADFSINHPPGWFVTTDPMTYLTGATEILTVATFDLDGIPQGGDNCSHIAEAAIEAMGDRDALLNLFNIYSTDAALHVGKIAQWPEDARGRSVAVQGCPDNGAELTHYYFAFRAGRHTYRATVVFGPDVDDEMKNRMLHVLNSFRPDE